MLRKKITHDICTEFSMHMQHILITRDKFIFVFGTSFLLNWLSSLFKHPLFLNDG